MIKLTKLNGKVFVLNCDLIETLESTPDTVVSTVSGNKYVVADSIDEIIEKVKIYKSEIYGLKRLKEEG